MNPETLKRLKELNLKWANEPLSAAEESSIMFEVMDHLPDLIAAVKERDEQSLQRCGCEWAMSELRRRCGLDETQIDLREVWLHIEGIMKERDAAQKALCEVSNNFNCTLALQGRGDCEHAVGLPGMSVPGQHDGLDDTKDVYGKPNGWCWNCWWSYRTHKAESDNRAAQKACDQFATLRKINVQRCESVFHKLADWTPAEWACAMAGEAGEVCNVAKKIKRLETGTNTAKDPQTIDECVRLMAGELADTIIYADLLAALLKIDLWGAVVSKFNAVSDRMKTDIKISTDCGKGYHHEREIEPLVKALNYYSNPKNNLQTTSSIAEHALACWEKGRS